MPNLNELLRGAYARKKQALSEWQTADTPEATSRAQAAVLKAARDIRRVEVEIAFKQRQAEERSANIS